jgi:hypothetical protein
VTKVILVLPLPEDRVRIGALAAVGLPERTWPASRKWRNSRSTRDRKLFLDAIYDSHGYDRDGRMTLTIDLAKELR